MIMKVQISDAVFWFTTLVSKQNPSSFYKTLNKVNAVEVKQSIWLKAKKQVYHLA
jgi:23S rRNA A1618 N6-methylase RlmF